MGIKTGRTKHDSQFAAESPTGMLDGQRLPKPTGHTHVQPLGLAGASS